jgi:hypothetical protein
MQHQQQDRGSGSLSLLLLPSSTGTEIFRRSWRKVVSSFSSHAFGAEDGEEMDNNNLYIVFFGILANVMILAACVTTMAFVRKKRAKALANNDSTDVVPSAWSTWKSSSRRKDVASIREREEDEPLSSPLPPPLPTTMTTTTVASSVLSPANTTQNISQDALRLLASCPPPRVVSTPCEKQQMQLLLKWNEPTRQQQQQIIHPSSTDMDVQAMLLASANVDHFFFFNKSRHHHASQQQKMQETSSLQWTLH